MKIWLRWIAVLPAAALAVFVSPFPLHWILYLTLTEFMDFYPEGPELFLTPAVVAIAFVWVGSLVAPRRNSQVAAVLCSIWILILITSVCLALNESIVLGVYFTSDAIGAAQLSSLAGALIGLYLGRTVSWEQIKESSNS